MSKKEDFRSAGKNYGLDNGNQPQMIPNKKSQPNNNQTNGRSPGYIDAGKQPGEKPDSSQAMSTIRDKVKTNQRNSIR